MSVIQPYETCISDGQCHKRQEHKNAIIGVMNICLACAFTFSLGNMRTPRFLRWDQGVGVMCQALILGKMVVCLDLEG